MGKLIGVLALLTAALVYAFSPVQSATRTIVIDAGHGGHDPGAQVEELMEKEIVQAIAHKMKEMHSGQAYELILLREEDAFMNLKDRVEKINKLQPDLLLSLHVNSSDNPANNGIELFVPREGAFYESSKAAATGLQDVLKKGLLEVSSVEEAGFFILKNCEAPSVLLDLGFLSNPSDRIYLSSEAGQEQLAQLLLEYLEQ